MMLKSDSNDVRRRDEVTDDIIGERGSGVSHTRRETGNVSQAFVIM